MKKFVETIKNIWSIEELKDKILMTLGLLLIYRIGSTVLLPGIDPDSLTGLQAQTSNNGLLGVLNAFTGGAFSRASVLALGIMPYISASIIIQLMGMAVPAVQKMQKDGESGRRKLNQITRYLTILIAGVQAPSYLANLSAQGVVLTLDPGTFWFLAWVTLTTGTIFAMWLGERITDKGIGNGISLLIMVGIIATLPQAFFQEMLSQVNQGAGWVAFIIELFALFVITMFAIALTQAVRQIPVQYAKQAAAGRGAATPTARQYLPMKVNAAGVMPIIFAQAIMFIPITVLQYSGAEGDSISWIITVFGNIQGFGYNLTFGLLIIIFTYFYTAIQVNTNSIADDLKRNGGFVPGIKPGAPTAEFLDTVLSRITFPGSLLLALIAVLPAVAMVVGLNTQWAYFYGGTSLLITVGVILDTLQQIESYLLNRHYDGLMKTGKLRGRTQTSTFG